jgi:WD40 repeat protein
MRVYRLPCATGTVPSTEVSGLSFAPDARRLAVIEFQNAKLRPNTPAIRWIDLASGETVRILTFPEVYAVALSPDHSLLGVGRLGGEAGKPSTLIERYELPNPNPALAWEIANYLPRSAACPPDGSGFAVALENRDPYQHGEGEFPHAVCGWDGRTGVRVGPVPLSWWPAHMMAFSPDGRWLACAGRGGRVLVLRWPGGEWIDEFPAPLTERIRFAPDRPLLAVVATKSVMVFDVPAVVKRAAGRAVQRLATLQRGHRDRVTDVAFAPTADRVLTCSTDETVRVWSLAERRCVRCFEWGIGALTAVAWSLDGLTCAAAGANRQVVVWDADG